MSEKFTKHRLRFAYRFHIIMVLYKSNTMEDIWIITNKISSTSSVRTLIIITTITITEITTTVTRTGKRTMVR